MKKYIITIAAIISLASCVPPGKLSEALDANALLNSKYDSLHNKLNDTVANFSNSLSLLNSNVNNLNDSVSYYRAIASKPPVITEGDVFLNQMLGLSLLSKSELAGINTTNGNNGGNNAWLEGFKKDMKKTKAGRLNNRRIRIVIMPTVTQVMNLSK
jgi:hypothetical protein